MPCCWMRFAELVVGRLSKVNGKQFPPTNGNPDIYCLGVGFPSTRFPQMRSGSPSRRCRQPPRRRRWPAVPRWWWSIFSIKFIGGIAYVRPGLCRKILHRRSLTAEKLAREIVKTLECKRMQARSREIAAGMASENGVQHAVTLIEGLFPGA